MKTKLCFIIPSLGRGGAERNLATVLNNISTDRYEVFLICLQGGGINHKKINPCKVQIIDLQHPSIYFAIFKIRKAIKDIKPDVLIGWMGFLNAYLAFFKFLFPASMKWVCRESSIPSIQNSYFKYPFIFSFLYKFLNRYDWVICQSQAMAVDLTTEFGVKREKIIVINNPGNFPLAFNIRPVGQDNGGERNLLYVGSISREKRVHLLLEALAGLPPNYKLTIVGNGTELKTLCEKIKRLGLQNRVTFRTDCSDPTQYYITADCMLLCSSHEGFPNVIIEAMGAGCPAIGFNIAGGANEILANYGGFVVREMDLNAFVSTIRQVCETEDIDRGRIAATARRMYDTRKIIQFYEEVFNLHELKKANNILCVG